jgi:transcriptional regulator with XRE-family HTH domain
MTKNKAQAIRDANNQLLWQEIRGLRKERKLTQQGLGKLVGTSTATISKLESGKQAIDISILMKIARALRFSVHRLIFNVQLRNLDKHSPEYHVLARFVDAVEPFES